MFAIEPFSSLATQELVEPRRLTGLVVALCEVRRVPGRDVVETGSEFKVAVALVEIGSDRISPRDVLIDVGQCCQSCERAVRFTDGNGTVESDDRSVGDSDELVVPLQDLHPVGVVEAGGAAIAAWA
jgi:hypothetical protein